MSDLALKANSVCQEGEKHLVMTYTEGIMDRSCGSPSRALVTTQTSDPSAEAADKAVSARSCFGAGGGMAQGNRHGLGSGHI